MASAGRALLCLVVIVIRVMVAVKAVFGTALEECGTVGRDGQLLIVNAGSVNDECLYAMVVCEFLRETLIG